jgi:hypothetical protein
MKLLLIFGSIFIPIIMFILQRKWIKLSLLFNVIATLSAIVFGSIASTAIHEIRQDETVFMTNIHGLFLNPLFLLTGAYLGVYFIYILFLWTINQLKI